MALSNLDNVMVVSTDGSYFGLNTAFLIDTAALTPEQLEALDEGTDSDRADLCDEVGIDLRELVREASL